MKTNRVIALILVAMFAVTLTACSSGGGTASTAATTTATASTTSAAATTAATTTVAATTTTAAAPASNLNTPGQYPIWTGEGTPTISVLFPAQNNYVTSYTDNVYTRMVQEQANIIIDFHFLPQADGATKLSTMVAAGDTLPDVLNYGINLATEKSYADAGALLDLTPYYDKGMAVHVDAAVAAYPTWQLKSNITTADGKIYAIPKIQTSPSNETKYKIWINGQWVTNVGMNLDDIKTTDDFYNMLVAFRDQDANGNGDKSDELPFCTSSGWGGTAYKYLTNAFVFEGDGDLFLLKDGEVSVSYIQDEWFDACRYIKNLVDENLLTKDSFTNTNDQVLAIATNADAIGVITSSSLGWMGSAVVAENPIRGRYYCINPLTGPDGVCYSAYAQSTTQGQWHVTSYAADPELCFLVGDMQFTEDYFLQGRFGLEGTNWMTKEDYLKANPGQTLDARYASMGYEGKYVFYNDLWNSQQDNNWYDQHCYFSGEVECQGMYVADDGKGTLINLDTNCTCRQETASGYYQLVKPDPDVYCPTLHFTDAELEEISEIQANLKTFVSEQRVKYYMGEENLIGDDGSAFKEELDIIGLQEFLDVCNTAYARQYK